jgi:hypothetical protein
MEKFLVSNYKYTSNNKRNNANKKRNLKYRQIMTQYNGILRSYIYGLLHPENAVNSSNVPKAPNYISIPTSNITFREAFDILPDKNGEFLLYWTPNFLCTQDKINYRVGNTSGDYKYSRNWIGGYDNNFECIGFNPVPAYTPPASFKKYRLVSAGCRITYKGAPINRSGILAHCLTYRSLPMPFFIDGNADRGWFMPAGMSQNLPEFFGELDDVDMTTVQNGMWNGVKNVQKDNTTFVVAVPTDPSDFIFEDDGFFYAAASASDTMQSEEYSWTDGNNVAHTNRVLLQFPQDGTPCSYIFRGESLSSNDRLYVEQYYNFEIIPTEASATILRPRPGLDKDLVDSALNVVNKVMNTTKGQNASADLVNNMIKDFYSNKGSVTIKAVENKPNLRRKWT